jgi:hypothetical protein
VKVSLHVRKVLTKQAFKIAEASFSQQASKIAGASFSQQNSDHEMSWTTDSEVTIVPQSLLEES